MATSEPRLARFRATQLHAQVEEVWYRMRAMPHDDITPEYIAAELERALTLAEEVITLETTKAELTAKLQQMRDLPKKLATAQSDLAWQRDAAVRLGMASDRVHALGREVA